MNMNVVMVKPICYIRFVVVNNKIKTMVKRYVWLLEDGKFSNSWDEETHKRHVDQGVIDHATKNGAKLIEYTCLNNEKFEFYNMMRLA